MRQITTSTDVYAAIWAARQQGEDTEDDILRRILGVKARQQRPANGQAVSKVIGFRDSRYGIELADGFEIFRTYKGREYRAKATSGSWLLMNTGDLHPSVNQLSQAIGVKIENAWNNWWFRGPDGKRRRVDELRVKRP